MGQGELSRKAGSKQGVPRETRRKPQLKNTQLFRRAAAAGGGRAGWHVQQQQCQCLGSCSGLEGVKPARAARPPHPREAIQRLWNTEEMLSKKEEFLEKKIEQELMAAKKHDTKIKRAAL